MATLHTLGSSGGVVAAPGATSAAAAAAPRTSISASLPSLLARTLPAAAVAANRRRQPPGAAVTASGPTPDERTTRLVSTQCQTEEDRTPTSGSLRSIAAPATAADPGAGLNEPIECDAAAPRRRRREKRRHHHHHHHRRSHNVQPLQQHVQQVLHDQTALPTVVDTADSHHHQTDRPPVSPSGSDHLPDILNAHMPPPYSTLPHNSERCMGMGPIPFTALPVPLPVVPVTLGAGVGGGVGGVGGAGVVGPAGTPSAAPLLGNSFSLPPAGGRRSRGSMYAGEESGKSCCGVMVTQTVSIRWFIIMIAFVGICCAVVGTVLGAMRSSGREHLTVSLLMIGVGIVLITVSGIAWRLTSQDAPSCRAMLGLGGSTLGAGAAGTPMLDSAECGAGLGAEANGRRFLSRIPPTYGRPHHPYAAMMYPEFQYRPPPPSYQASMQEYRLRLLLLDRDRQQQQQRQQAPPAATVAVPSAHSTPLSRACVAAASGALHQPPHPPVSPPPTYRSQTNTLVRPSIPMIRDSDASRPPSYRSRSGASTAPDSRADHHHVQQQQHPALQSQQVTNRHDHDNNSGVVQQHQQQHPHSVIEAKIKSSPFETVVVESGVGVVGCVALTKRDKDNNTVTIVQTNSSSQVLGNGRSASPALVTVITHHTAAPSSVSSGSSSTSSSSSSASSTVSSSTAVVTQNLQVLAQL